MNKIPLIALILILFLGCKNQEYNAEEYFETINKAEIQIVKKDFSRASELYDIAFKNIQKPFGKDVYNSAIVNSIIGDRNKLLSNVQTLVNNTEDLSFIESTLVNKYISRKDWDKILIQQEVVYDEKLRYEMEKISERDQKFRPLYDTQFDSIEKIRKENMAAIFNFTANKELPGHQEIGYTKNLKNQPHHIVLHHTSQRRSQDKNVKKLDSILKEAVRNEKMDPEQAILYLKFQDDREAGPYVVYTVFQVQHPLLPDSLQNKTWERNIEEETKVKADSVRQSWLAVSLDDLSLKAKYLRSTEHPFIFSGIERAIYQLPLDFDEKEVMEQYKLQTSRGLELKN